MTTLTPQEKEDMVMTLKIRAMKLNKFFSYVLVRVPIEIADKDIPNAYAYYDGQKIVVGPKAFEKSKDFAVFAVLHEVMHHIFAHHKRIRQYPNPDAYRWGSDVVVNGYLLDKMLKNAQLGTYVKSNYATCNPAKMIYRPDWENKNAEEWSDEWKNQQTECGLRPDEDEDGPDGQKKQGQGSAGETAVKGVNWERVAIEAYTYAKMIGENTADYDSLIEDILHPPIPLHRFIYRFLQKSTPFDYTFSKINKKYMASGIALPSTKTKYEPIYVGIDVSGSVADNQVAYFLKVLRSIRARFPNNEIYVIQTDTEIKDIETADQFIKSRKRKGVGGTNFHAIFDYLNGLKFKRPSMLIFLTDGYAVYPEKKPRFPVVWALTKDHQKPPWGIRTIIPYV
jgi:predicted metal-dependent peptidase